MPREVFSSDVIQGDQGTEEITASSQEGLSECAKETMTCKKKTV